MVLLLKSPSGHTRAWLSLQDQRSPRLLRQTIAIDPSDDEDCPAGGVDAADAAGSTSLSVVGSAAPLCGRCVAARRGPWRTLRLRTGSTIQGWLVPVGPAVPLEICMGNGSNMTLGAGECLPADAAPNPDEFRPQAVAPAWVLVSSNVQITLTRIRPDGHQV